MPPHVTLCLLFLPVVVFPPMAELALLEGGDVRMTLMLLALHAALGLALLPFLARFALYLCVFRELGKVCDFAAKLRRGALPAPFELPGEREDDHLLLRLKRSLNWMLHALARREESLLCRLEETDQARRIMEDASRTDPLTGLGNRRHFEQALTELPPVHPGCGPTHRLLLIDCDKFKAVNDMHGHLAGDDVLCALARIIRECVRAETDFAFRLGGDEFAVIMACPGDHARSVAERIRRGFREANGRGCTLSMGLTECRMDAGCPSNWNSVIARADAAVYEAKGAGGDAVRIR